MTKHVWTFFSSIVFWLSGSLSSIAGPMDIVGWNLTDTTENEAPGDQPFTLAAFSAPNVTGNVVTRGGGLAANIAKDSINARNWGVYQSLAPVLSTGYFTFGFIVDPGYRVSLAELLIGTRSSNKGPGTVVLRYSGDGFTDNFATFNQPGTSPVNSTVDLSSLTNLSGTIEFRLYSASTTSADGSTSGGTDDVGGVQTSGTFRITNYFVGSNDTGSFRFTGTVEAIPEPSSLALLSVLGVGAFGFWLRRRKSRIKGSGAYTGEGM